MMLFLAQSDYVMHFVSAVTVNEKKSDIKKSVNGLTLRVFSTSPQGSLLTKSMPVKGVPVGGNNTEASIIRYSTFRGLL